MNLENPIALILAVFFLVVSGYLIAMNFSTEARMERRRRKNNTKVISRAGRPTVKFSVKTATKKERQEK